MKKHKKCPFCGGEPKLESAGYRTKVSAIYCQTCGASSGLAYGSAHTIEAWAAWDRREDSK